MKLTDAMVMGSVFAESKRGDIDSCALGMAGNAVGIPSTAMAVRTAYAESRAPTPRLLLIFEQWPWLSKECWATYTYGLRTHPDGTRWVTVAFIAETYGHWIASTFNDLVCRGQMTLEQLVEQIRAFEPECGECNRFECCCRPSQVAVETKPEALVAA
jgi:hypothetical protein